MPSKPKDSPVEGLVNGACEVIGEITPPLLVATRGSVWWSMGETGVVSLLVKVIMVEQWSYLHEMKEPSLGFGYSLGGSKNFQDQLCSNTM